MSGPADSTSLQLDRRVHGPFTYVPIKRRLRWPSAARVAVNTLELLIAGVSREDVRLATRSCL